jgi:hypothetical protein
MRFRSSSSEGGLDKADSFDDIPNHEYINTRDKSPRKAPGIIKDAVSFPFSRWLINHVGWEDDDSAISFTP